MRVKQKRLPSPLGLAIPLRGLRQLEVAERIGISPEYLSRISRGKFDPSNRIKRKLYRLLGVRKGTIFPEG